MIAIIAAWVIGVVLGIGIGGSIAKNMYQKEKN
jgi:hypothetical protein